MIRRFVLAASLYFGLASAVAAQPAYAGDGGGAAYAARWTKLANKHYRLVATPEGDAWEGAMLAVHNKFWNDVSAACEGKASRGGIGEFQAVAVIDEAGTITQFLTLPNSPHLSCYSTQMVGRKYPAPPVAPFYEVYTIRTRD